MSTIPASQIVQVTPGVLDAGGDALDIIGLFTTTSTRVPIGAVKPFASATDVANFFGVESTEADAATIYFDGPGNATRQPGSLLFVQYNAAPVAGYLQGGDVGAALTLTQLKAITPGTLTIDFAGSPLTSSSINLSGATSFSNAATLILAAFTSPAFGVTYDSVSGAFVFTSTSTGATETITYPTTDAFATSLLLTQATGAVLSQGAAGVTPAALMASVVALTQNWVTFTNLQDPDGGSGNALKLAFAAWTNGQNNRYAYFPWDTDATPTVTVPATTSLGYLVNVTEAYSGTTCVWAPDYTKSAFLCGWAASINFDAVNGRQTAAFRSQAGLVADVTTATVAADLMSNYYNFYGAYATANQGFVFFYPGTVSGKFKWLDSYINQVWLNNNFQLAGMELLTQVGSVPYNPSGYTLIEQGLMDPVNEGLSFGAFRAGVTLSASQATEVNQAAGANVAPTLTAQGWYLQVLDPGASVRQGRGSPEVTFWYMDGESVQQLDISSILIQ